MSGRRDSGERFDEAQGGGRGSGSVGRTEEEEFAEDQATHQERGQTKAEEEERGG